MSGARAMPDAEAGFLHDQAELLRVMVEQAQALIGEYGFVPATDQVSLVRAIAAIAVNVEHAAKRLERPLVTALPPGVVRLPVRPRAVPGGGGAA